MKLRTERDKRVRGRKGKEENLIFYFSENYQKTKIRVYYMTEEQIMTF